MSTAQNKDQILSLLWIEKKRGREGEWGSQNKTKKINLWF